MRNHSGKMRKFQWIFGLLLLILATACAPNIERLKKKGDVDKLIEIIEIDLGAYTDRVDAVIALGELGDKKAIEPLIEDLYYSEFSTNSNPYNDVIKESLMILGENYPEEIIGYLIESGLYKGGIDPKRAIDLREILIKIGPVIVDPFLDAVAVNENDVLEQYALSIFLKFDSSIIPILEEAHNNDPESLFIREALNNAAGYHSVTVAAEAVCQGRTIPYAADYDPSMQGNRGVYYGGIEWIGNDIAKEYSNDVAEKVALLQVVFCFDEEAVLIETCTYMGPNIERYQKKYNISIVCAKTGEILAENTFTSEPPRECKQSEVFDITKLNGAFDYGPIVEWLRQTVEP
ncbi:MAG: hypothetical protein MUO40_11205 [Anaerolineaceae bacterium]|nr:hypothetical protein [Anaerolineaceae bacterium]